MVIIYYSKSIIVNHVHRCYFLNKKTENSTCPSLCQEQSSMSVAEAGPLPISQVPGQNSFTGFINTDSF